MISFILSEFWQYITGGAAILVALLAARRSGGQKVRLEKAKDEKNRVAAARKSIREGRASGMTPQERKDANDAEW